MAFLIDQSLSEKGISYDFSDKMVNTILSWESFAGRRLLKQPQTIYSEVSWYQVRIAPSTDRISPVI